MNKKIIFTGTVLVMLALITTACKLPASGSPPPVTTQVPVVPTSTTGSSGGANQYFRPTHTGGCDGYFRPTHACYRQPRASNSCATHSDTAYHRPSASNLRSEALPHWSMASWKLDRPCTYVLGASATQTMSVKVTSPNADVYLGVFGADGQVFLTNTTQDTLWSDTLPTTQDYYISLTAANGKTSYTLSVDIPPLATVPTANITPVAGTFDPVATYGNPTFDDPMTGGNINDWTNPVSGLLPRYQLHQDR